MGMTGGVCGGGALFTFDKEGRPVFGPQGEKRQSRRPKERPKLPWSSLVAATLGPSSFSNQEKGETGKAQGKVRYRGSGYPGDYPYAEDVIPLLARGKSGYLRG